VYLTAILGYGALLGLGSSTLNSENLAFISFLFFIGFGVKIPVWPFHYWLTRVHVEASTGFSIFLSGFLVKAAVFVC
jgi:NADH:ubiquinone oxidoreductase subunit 4 (subunit M)